MRLATILTSEQASFLCDLVREHRTAIIERSSLRWFDGLWVSLMPIAPAPTVREGSILAPSSELSWLCLSKDQAQILYQLVHEYRADVTERWSLGIWNGLSEALCEIDRGGGAYIRSLPFPPAAPSLK